MNIEKEIEKMYSGLMQEKEEMKKSNPNYLSELDDYAEKLLNNPYCREFSIRRDDEFLNKLIKKYKIAKKNINPILKEKGIIIPLFIVKDRIEEKGFFAGDGFFYGIKNKIFYKYYWSVYAFDFSATPENLWKAYMEFNDEKISLEDSLNDAINALNQAFEDYK